MAVTVRDRKGRERILLNPSEKGGKFARELREHRRYTNKGVPKSGKASYLTQEGRAFRAGYLEAQKDSAKAYKAKNKRRNERQSFYERMFGGN